MVYNPWKTRPLDTPGSSSQIPLMNFSWGIEDCITPDEPVNLTVSSGEFTAL